MSNEKAYVVEHIAGDMQSVKFLSLLKKIIDDDNGYVGMSGNTIITSVAMTIGFHNKNDFEYYVTTALKKFYNN